MRWVAEQVAFLADCLAISGKNQCDKGENYTHFSLKKRISVFEIGKSSIQMNVPAIF